MPLAEVADGSEVRRTPRHYHHKIVPFAASSCDPPRRIQPTRIAVQQKRHHHPRVKRRLPEPAHIAARDLLEIEALPHQLNDKPRDMAFRHKVLHIRRQKQRLIDIPGAKILAHSPSLNQTRSELNSDYSDRLLVQPIRNRPPPIRSGRGSHRSRDRPSSMRCPCGCRAGARHPRAQAEARAADPIAVRDATRRSPEAIWFFHRDDPRGPYAPVARTF